MGSDDSDKTVAGFAAERMGLPDKIGDYKIHRRIGRGGMSYVYSATHCGDQTPVALKVLDDRLADQSTMQERFRREANAIQSLRHEHIVPLHGFGNDNGTLYLAMKLIDGVTVTDLIQHLRREMNQAIVDGGGTPSTEIVLTTENATSEADIAACAAKVLTSESSFLDIAELMAVAAEAVNGAHNQGIIHRDIKPSNLMIDREGKLWLTDFGLASNDDGQTVVTHTGELVGTPHYMSPEQASADRDGYDERTDIYSLGATLYELATLTRPYNGDRIQVLMEISTGRLTAPSRVRAEVPGPLEAIILKAMAYSPSDRYQSGTEMADDLRRFVRGESTMARQPTLADHAVRWITRNPRSSAATLLAIASVVTLVIAIQFFNGRKLAMLNEQLAESNESLLDSNVALTQSRSRLQKHLYVADVSGAFRAYAQRDIDAVDQLLARHKPGGRDNPTQADLRGFEWRLLDNLCKPPEMTILDGHEPQGTNKPEPSKVALIPNSDDCLTVGYDGYLRRWSLRDHEQKSACHIGPILDTIAVSNDGKWFVTSERIEKHGNPIAIRDVKTGAIVQRLTSHDNTLESACFSPDRKYVATADRYNEVMLQRTDGTGVTRRKIGSRSESLAFTPDGKYLMAIVRSGQQYLEKLSLPDLKTVDKWSCSVHPNVFAISGDGRRLVAADANEIALYSLPAMKQLIYENRIRGRIRCVALNQDGSRIYAGCDNGSLFAWDLRGAASTDKLPPPIVMSTGTQEVTSLGISRDDRAVVTTNSGSLQVWHAAQIDAVPQKLPRTVEQVASTKSDATSAFMRFADGSVGRLNFASRTFHTVAEVEPDEHLHLAVSPDQETIAASAPGRIIILNADDGSRITELDVRVENDPTDGLAFTRDGRSLIHLLNDHFQVYHIGKSAKTCFHDRDVPLGSDGVNGLTVSPQTGEIVVSASAVSKLHRFNEAGFACEGSISCKYGNFTAFCYSDSGALIALGYGDGTVEVRNANFDPLTTLKGHRSPVRHCIFMEEDQKLITCSDGQIRFWDIDSGRELGVLSNDEPIRHLHYSAAQDCLFTFPYWRPVEVWPTRNSFVDSNTRSDVPSVH